MKIEEVMRLCPVIPVLVIEDAAYAQPIAKALVAGGGLRALEVTLRDARRAGCDRRDEPRRGRGGRRRHRGQRRRSARQHQGRRPVHRQPGPDRTPRRRRRPTPTSPSSPASPPPATSCAGSTWAWSTSSSFPPKPPADCAALTSLAAPFFQVEVLPSTGGVSEANAAALAGDARRPLRGRQLAGSRAGPPDAAAIEARATPGRAMGPEMNVHENLRASTAGLASSPTLAAPTRVSLSPVWTPGGEIATTAFRQDMRADDYAGLAQCIEAYLKSRSATRRIRPRAYSEWPPRSPATLCA